MYPRGTFSVVVSRARPSASRHHKAFHNENFHKLGAISRARVYDRLQNRGQDDECGSDSGGSHSADRVVYSSKSRGGPHPSTRKGRFLSHRGDESRGDGVSHFSIRSTFRVIKTDFSSILLNNMKTRYLVLGPGGMGYFAMLGAYTKLHDELSSLKGISGSSAGALLGLFIALGKSPTEINEISFNVNIKDLVKYNIKSFLDNYGLIDHSQIKEKLLSICERDITFKDLEIEFYVAAFNVNTSNTEYFSKITHPDMSVVDAVCMSISVPFLFSSVRWKDNVYIDGGTMEKYPAPPFLNKNPNEVLVMRIITNPVSSEIHNFKSFVYSFIRSTLKNRSAYDGIFPTITLDLSSYNIFDFNMSEEEKLKLFFMYNYSK